MITYLVAEHGLDRVEAYMLCSVAGDLKMHEVVRTHDILPIRVSERLTICFHDRWTCRITLYVFHTLFRSVCVVCSILERSEC